MTADFPNSAFFRHGSTFAGTLTDLRRGKDTGIGLVEIFEMLE